MRRADAARRGAREVLEGAAGRRRKNAADVTQNIKCLTNFDSLISYMRSYTRCGFFWGIQGRRNLAKIGRKISTSTRFFLRSRAEDEFPQKIVFAYARAS